jgi:hypothetical protein
VQWPAASGPCLQQQLLLLLLLRPLPLPLPLLLPLLLLLQRAAHGLGFASFEPRQLCIIAYAITQLGPAQLGLHTPTTPSSSSSSSSDVCQQLYGPDLLDDLFTAIAAGFDRCSAHDTAQAVYALAKLRHVPPAGWLAAWLQRAQQLLPQFSSQGLANAAYGLAAVMWRAGQLTRAPSSSEGQGVAYQQQQQQLLAAARRWLQACLRVSLLHLPLLHPGELFGQLLWAAGKLRCPLPQPAGHHILAKTQTLLAACDAAHLSSALYCFARLQQSPSEAWLGVFWQRVGDEFQGFSDQQLSRLLWAAAALQLQLPGWIAWRLRLRVRQLVAAGAAGRVRRTGERNGCCLCYLGLLCDGAMAGSLPLCIWCCSAYMASCHHKTSVLLEGKLFHSFTLSCFVAAAAASAAAAAAGHLTSTVRSCALLQLQLPGRLWAR